MDVLDSPAMWGWSFALCWVMVYTGYGACKELWTKRGINVDYMVNFEMEKTDGGKVILANGIWMGVAWNVGFLMYLKIRRDAAGVFGKAVPSWICQFLVVVMVVVHWFVPGRKRKEIWRGVWETVITPWGRVGFRENLIADGLTSAVKVNTGEETVGGERE